MASRHDWLNGARTAKRDEFYTLYGTVDAELTLYMDELRGRPIVCPCDDRPSVSMFPRWFMDHMAELGTPRLTCLSYEPDVGSLFETVPAMRWDLTPDGRRGPYSPADMTATPLASDGSLDSPDAVGLYRTPGVVVASNPPFSLMRRFLGLMGDTGADFIVLGNLLAAASTEEGMRLLMAGRLRYGLSIHSGSTFFRIPDRYPRTATEVRPDGTVGVNSVRWLTSLGTAMADKSWTPTGRLYAGHEADYPRYDTVDAIDVGAPSLIPDDWRGLMGVPVTILDRWAPGAGGPRLAGRLSNGLGGTDVGAPVVGGRQTFLRLLLDAS